MHHKRKRRKNLRAGCLFCKYWKGNGHRNPEYKEFEKFSDHKRRVVNKEKLKEVA